MTQPFSIISFNVAKKSLRQKMKIYTSKDPVPLIEFDQGTLVLSHFHPTAMKNLPLTVWDPRISSWRAPAYAYRMIKEHLLVLKVHYVDRSQHSWQVESNWSSLNLRDYQAAALLAWEISGRNGIICLPTGTGKTKLAIAAIKSLKVPTICLVPTRILLDQWSRNLQEVYQGSIGILGDGIHTIGPITVGTFESVYRYAHRYGNRYKLLIVDEVHHFGDRVKDESLEMMCAEYRLGLTATPPLEEIQLQALYNLVGPIVHTQGIEAFAGTYLADFTVRRCLVPMTSEEKFAYKICYEIFREFYLSFQKTFPNSNWREFVKVAGKTTSGRQAIASHKQSRIMAWLPKSKIEMLTRLLTLHREQKLLIFTASTQSALTISKYFLITPIVSGIGKRERIDILTRFRDGKIKTLVSCQVLNEGFDIPTAEIAIIVSGSQGEREHIQRIGRILRPAPDKQAIVYELITTGTSEVRKSEQRRANIDPKRFTTTQYS